MRKPDIMIVCETPCRFFGVKVTAQERSESDKAQLKSYIKENNTPKPAYVDLVDKGIVRSHELGEDAYQTVFYFKYDLFITDMINKDCYA